MEGYPVYQEKCAYRSLLQCPCYTNTIANLPNASELTGVIGERREAAGGVRENPAEHHAGDEEGRGSECAKLRRGPEAVLAT